MFVMSFCKASTSSNSSTTSLMHEGVTEAKFRSRRLAIHIIVTIFKAMGSVKYNRCVQGGAYGYA